MTRDELEGELRGALDADDAGLVGCLGKMLDQSDVPARSPRLLSAALWYAEQGLRVFPLKARSKVPYDGSHGFEDASTDATRIRRHWIGYPDSNIGIATGHLVDVIDIDGPEGHVALARNFFDDDDQWDGPLVLGTVSTPRLAGKHLYVPADGKRNRTNLVPHIDLRGIGGYVVAPPSVTDVGMYRWIVPLDLGKYDGG